MFTTLQDTLMRDLGLDELPEEERGRIAEQIAGIVFQGTMLRVLDLLDEVKQEELGDLFEASAKSPDDVELHQKLFSFLREHVPNLDAIVQDEVLALKAEYSAIQQD